MSREITRTSAIKIVTNHAQSRNYDRKGDKIYSGKLEGKQTS
jgi:hypothetical protein